MQGHHFSMLQHEAEKLKVDIEKMRSELRFVMLITAASVFVSNYLQLYYNVGTKLTKSLLGNGWI